MIIASFIYEINKDIYIFEKLTTIEPLKILVKMKVISSSGYHPKFTKKV